MLQNNTDNKSLFLAIKKISLLLSLAGILLGFVGCAGQNHILCLLSKDNPPQFDYQSLLSKMELARISYREPEEIHAAYDSLYQVKVIPLPSSAGQVAIFTDTLRQVQIVAIRGTVVKEFKSILTDAQYTKQKDPKLGVYVHAGFGKAIAELHALVVPELNKDYQIEITGHSLGGALSVLLTYYLKEDNFKLGETVTFGQPKVTNKEGAEKYKDVKLLRVVNGQDPVAYVPPNSFVGAINLPYQHAGGALILNDSLESEWVCEEANKIDFATQFWSDLVGQEEGAVGTFVGNLSYHRDKNYIKNIKKHINP